MDLSRGSRLTSAFEIPLRPLFVFCLVGPLDSKRVAKELSISPNLMRSPALYLLSLRETAREGGETLTPLM